MSLGPVQITRGQWTQFPAVACHPTCNTSDSDALTCRWWTTERWLHVRAFAPDNTAPSITGAHKPLHHSKVVIHRGTCVLRLLCLVNVSAAPLFDLMYAQCGSCSVSQKKKCLCSGCIVAYGTGFHIAVYLHWTTGFALTKFSFYLCFYENAWGYKNQHGIIGQQFPFKLNQSVHTSFIIIPTNACICL